MFNIFLERSYIVNIKQTFNKNISNDGFDLVLMLVWFSRNLVKCK